MTKCSAKTKKGVPCTRRVKENGLCDIHLRVVEEPETSPWNSVDNPWNPDKTKTKQKREGFRSRFVAPEKVENRKTEGWVIAKAKDYGEAGMDGIVKRNELVLMEIPEERAKEREAYIASVTNRRSKSAKEIQVDKKLLRDVHFEDKDSRD